MLWSRRHILQTLCAGSLLALIETPDNHLRCQHPECQICRINEQISALDATGLEEKT
jgi:hypothetical protein